jgi:PilZ domain
MAWKQRVSDRRSRPRYEIVGTLRGTLVTHEELSLDNISPGGFALDAACPLDIDSIHSVRLETPEAVIDVDVRVRHCTPHGDAGRYSIGVELTRPLPSALPHPEEPVRSDSTPLS